MCWSHSGTHQAHKDAEELNHIRVRHRVESSHQGVEDGDEGWDHHRHVDVYVHDHAQSRSCGADTSSSSDMDMDGNWLV